MEFIVFRSVAWLNSAEIREYYFDVLAVEMHTCTHYTTEGFTTPNPSSRRRQVRQMTLT